MVCRYHGPYHAHLAGLTGPLGRPCDDFRVVSSTPKYTQPLGLLRALHRRQAGKAWSHDTFRLRQGSHACSRPLRRRPGVPSAEAVVEARGGSMLRAQISMYDCASALFSDLDQIRSTRVVGPTVSHLSRVDDRRVRETEREGALSSGQSGARLGLTPGNRSSELGALSFFTCYRSVIPFAHSRVQVFRFTLQ